MIGIGANFILEADSVNQDIFVDESKKSISSYVSQINRNNQLHKKKDQAECKKEA